jgi:drug/metabolite transporter (DMT)-like permease
MQYYLAAFASLVGAALVSLFAGLADSFLTSDLAGALAAVVGAFGASAAKAVNANTDATIVISCFI